MCNAKTSPSTTEVGQGSGQWKVKEEYYGGQLIDHLLQWLCYVSDLFRRTGLLLEMGVGLSKA